MKSQFSRDFCRDGRAYLLGRDLYKRYTATDKIIKTIKENIRGYIFVDASVRITLDSNHSDPERAISKACPVTLMIVELLVILLI